MSFVTLSMYSIGNCPVVSPSGSLCGMYFLGLLGFLCVLVALGLGLGVPLIHHLSNWLSILNSLVLLLSVWFGLGLLDFGFTDFSKSVLIWAALDLEDSRFEGSGFQGSGFGSFSFFLSS